METRNHKELNLIILFKQTTLKVKQSYKTTNNHIFLGGGGGMGEMMKVCT
jgi:hypothetical protein